MKTLKNTGRRSTVGLLIGSLAMVGSVVTLDAGVAQANPEAPSPVPMPPLPDADPDNPSIPVPGGGG